jgi:hypothetical protein
MNKKPEKSFEYLPFLSAAVAAYVAKFLSTDELELLSSLLASISAEMTNIVVARSIAENSCGNKKIPPGSLPPLPPVFP